MLESSKEKRILACLFFTILLSLTSFSCSKSSNEDVENYIFTQEEDKIANFKNGNSDKFRISSGYSNNFPFNCKWKSEAIDFKHNVMQMNLYKENDYFVGSELQSIDKYSYGYFSTEMKAIKCSGVISSFFTYTNNPWDEIDIEFLGKDTTKVQFNYYTNGVGGHEYLYDLGFDASTSYHEYGFLYQKDFIAWFVDGKEVYRAIEDIPTTPAKIMMNVWTGVGDNFNEWCGALDESKLPQTASYKRIGYKNINN